MEERIDPQTWPVLSRLLDEWLDLEEGGRGPWLASLSPEYDAILPRFRQMLETYEKADERGFLKDPVPIPVAVTGRIEEGAQLGPYRLLRPLGQGGMASVWLAEGGDSGLRRRVALKIPHLLTGGGALAERFARERDILAQLTHPRIARLYEAGVAASGLPYLVLEYVEGAPITAYCDERRLGVRERIALFLEVLHGVQYAHANLVVHRDLKPSNILVSADGEVKLLDFGIAKLLTDGQGVETELTRVGGRALTPDYASPEQVLGQPITTASDVYSLGVLLCELLTGERPYRATRDTLGALEEAILNRDPVRPSQLAQQEEKAQARRLAAKKLAAELRGDLDTIILKALEKKPEARYATVDAFADDLQRYLNGETVRARPESAWYRTRKFIRRNHLAVGSGVVVVAALATGMGVALHQAHLAREQARKAEAVQEFLEDIFLANSITHPDPVRARQTTARELLDIGASKLDQALTEAPEAKLSVLETLSGLYTDLGMKEQAVAIKRKRVEVAKAAFGPMHPYVAQALVDLANGIGESSAANDLPAVLAEAERVLDANHDTRSKYRAFLHRAKGRYAVDYDPAKAVEESRKAVEILRGLPDRAELVMALNGLGQSLTIHGDFPEAIKVLSEAAAVGESTQGEAKGRLASIYAYLGNCQYRVLDVPGAEKSYRLAVETARKVDGEDHEDVVQTRQRFGWFLCETGRYAQGLEQMKAATELALRIKGPADLFHYGGTAAAYGRKLIAYGRIEEGMRLLAQAVDLQRNANRNNTRGAREKLEGLAAGEMLLGRYQRAARLLEEAGNRKEQAVTRALLALAMGKAGDAERILAEAPADTGTRSAAQLRLTLAKARVELAMGHLAEAARLAREARTWLESSPVRPYWKEHEAEAALLEGKAMAGEGHTSEALPLLERAATLNAEVLDPTLSPVLAESQTALAECLKKVGREAEASKALAAAQAIRHRHQAFGAE